MEYLLPSQIAANAKKKQTQYKPIDITVVQKQLSRTSSALAVLMATSQLIGTDDKKKIITNLKGLNRTINDAARRSGVVNENADDISATSGDEEMLRWMHVERDTLQGLIQSTLHIVDRLHITNRMDDDQYRRVNRFYKSFVAMNDAIARKLEIATK